jgi:hemolysin D
MSEAPVRRLPIAKRPPPPAKLGPLGRPLKLVTSSDDREFLPAALEILETPASPGRIAFVWILFAIFASAITWSWIAKLDIYTTAPGRVQPVGRSKIVESLDPGKIETILVTNGSKVRKGQVLLTLDPTEADADRDKSTSDLAHTEAEIARRRAEIDAVQSGATAIQRIVFPTNVGKAARIIAQKVFIAELSQYFSSLNTDEAKLAEAMATRGKLISTIASRKHLIAVLQQQLKMKQELQTKHVGSLLQVLEAQQQLDQGLTDLSSDEGQLQEAKASVVAAKRTIGQLQQQFIADQADKLADAIKQRNDLEQDLVKAITKVGYTELRAPVSGMVQQLAVTTIGEVVTPGQPLLVVVPEKEPMVVEALVQSSDFGFVKVGQKAVIKLDAFPSGQYGVINGEVMQISRDSVYDKDVATADATSLQQSNKWMLSATPKTEGLVYPVWIRPAHDWIEADGKKIFFTAGMTAQIEIRTGKRRIIDYLLSPLREVATQAGHER